MAKDVFDSIYESMLKEDTSPIIGTCYSCGEDSSEFSKDSTGTPDQPSYYCPSCGKLNMWSKKKKDYIKFK
jgi:hypothetical protein